MTFLLLIVEPVGQRAERGPEAGRELYEDMLRYTDALQAEGVLRASSALLDTNEARRLEIRDGRRTVIDGPFTEAKEMVGGFFLIDVATRDDALALAARCPAAEWASVEVRETGPCYLSS
jgi:hypothetical protein